MKNLNDPHIVINKSNRSLKVFDGEELVRSFSVALGFDPKRDKKVEDDGRTPEGEFYVFTKNPQSRFHLSLGVSYPGKEGAERGLEAGLISQAEHDEIVAAIAEKRMPLKKLNSAVRSTSTGEAPTPTGPTDASPSATMR